jgi:hypothetical protein
LAISKGFSIVNHGLVTRVYFDFFASSLVSDNLSVILNIICLFNFLFNFIIINNYIINFLLCTFIFSIRRFYNSDLAFFIHIIFHLLLILEINFISNYFFIRNRSVDYIWFSHILLFDFLWVYLICNAFDILIKVIHFGLRYLALGINNWWLYWYVLRLLLFNISVIWSILFWLISLNNRLLERVKIDIWINRILRNVSEFIIFIFFSQFLKIFFLGSSHSFISIMIDWLILSIKWIIP